MTLRIEGLVHGVYFRAGMLEEATRQGVAGWVRNSPDGSVEAFLEGGRAAVESVVSWAHRGPPRARVDSVNVKKADAANLKGFRIVG